MISQEAQLNARKCRFCYMCRHLCPVQLVTGREANTPRAKGLLLSMVDKGITEFTPDMAEIMYECLLCNACTDNCVTGYNPPLFIREARTEAVVRGMEPPEVKKVIDRIFSTGRAFEDPVPDFGNHEPSEILLYIGEVASAKAKEMAEAVVSLLKKADVKFMILPQEPSSGAILCDLIGYTAESQKAAEACAKAVNETGAKAILVLDSYDQQIMSEKYPEWGFALKPQIISVSAYIAQLLSEGKLKVGRKASGKAVFHDDDRAARTFHEFKPGREIAKALGYDLGEMFNHYELAKSCGSSAAKIYMPETVKKIAAARWDDLLRTDAETMLTVNPESYECLKDAVPEGRKLEDLYQVLDQAT